MLRTEIKLEFWAAILANPFTTILAVIGFLLVMMWALSWGAYSVIAFFAGIGDWFEATIMSWADWMMDNFGDWIEPWL